MSQGNAITILGCGGSSGCPMLGCQCSVCQSIQPKNRRSRTSAYLEWAGRKIVIDTGPDFRYQALREKIGRVDAVLYTHAHADHVNGMDDLRAYCFYQKSKLPLFSNEATLSELKRRFGYAFLPPQVDWNRPSLEAKTLKQGINDVLGIKVVLFELAHGQWSTACYRIGNMAWMTDISTIPDQVIHIYLKNLDYLFLSCLSQKKVSSHLSVEEAFFYAKKIKARQTYFIHMSHQIDYESLVKICPPNTTAAYDGLRVCL
ncbi:MAG: MBL fold metallo-hydrolase [Neisseriaceae bacterium]